MTGSLELKYNLAELSKGGNGDGEIVCRTRGLFFFLTLRTIENFVGTLFKKS